MRHILPALEDTLVLFLAVATILPPVLVGLIVFAR